MVSLLYSFLLPLFHVIMFVEVIYKRIEIDGGGSFVRIIVHLPLTSLWL